MMAFISFGNKLVYLTLAGGNKPSSFAAIRRVSSIPTCIYPQTKVTFFKKVTLATKLLILNSF